MTGNPYKQGCTKIGFFFQASRALLGMCVGNFLLTYTCSEIARELEAHWACAVITSCCICASMGTTSILQTAFINVWTQWYKISVNITSAISHASSKASFFPIPHD